MINVQNIILKRGTKTVFDGLNLSIHAGHRVGIVGRNGIGKSSLFLLLRDRLLPEEGEVKLPKSWQIAHLEQETKATEQTALEWVMDGDKALRDLQRRIARAEREGDDDRLARLFAELEAIDGYVAETRAGQILHGLGFDPGDETRAVSDFSGGWRIRLNLAQTLMGRAELLLLDEPTNHLDLDAAMWLEQWLTRREGTTLVISHDRDFLDRVATDIVHLEHGRARSYRGNYSSFERQRADSLAREQASYEKQQRRVKEIEAFVNRFRAKATKARQAQSRVKELERMKLIAPAFVDSPYRFSFPNPQRTSNPLLQIEHGALGYDDITVLEDVRLTLQPGDRIGLLGKNGAGKSTLLRSLANELPLKDGEFERGKYASIGYFTQHTAETLVPERSPMAHLAEIDPTVTDQASRNYLGGWGFPGDMALNPVEVLSGGEKARLALALIAWNRPALLLLDEPTNHLDLEMRHALNIALQSYEGALVIVSHDRHLIENVVDELVLVAHGQVTPYKDTLDEYRDWLLGKESDSDRERSPDREANSRAARRRETARQREAVKPLRDALRAVEKKLAALQPKLTEITVQLADTETYETLSSEEVSKLVTRHKKYQQQVDALEEEWIEASEKLEAAAE